MPHSTSTAPSPSLAPRPARVSFAEELDRHGDRTALITADETISYRELARRVDSVADHLGEHRRLIVIRADNSVEAVVTYLAALTGGHPALLVPAGPRSPAAESLVDAYDPDVIAGRSAEGGRWYVRERRAGSAHHLHPDLALLLSTSGSTGSPKLVRLSGTNLQANAEAIASYLNLTSADRAITSLPMSYCYGLSVINSHLAVGAGIALTSLSVADACFWELARSAGVTGLAGVPYTFDLLDRVGFEDVRPPRLRYVTQAGGRLAPERVVRYAALGRREGWRFFVMYGQTEATARMAYLPPELAERHPDAIGRPIPGGAFRLEPVDGLDPEIGELVYTGPNVMLGYAEGPADLACGRTVTELRTGDLARCGENGLYAIVGRQSRFAKILGLRIDPDQVEAELARHGVQACCVGRDDELTIAVVDRSGSDQPDDATLRRLVADRFGLPPRAVRVHRLGELPRGANGKVDYAAVAELTAEAARAGGADVAARPATGLVAARPATGSVAPPPATGSAALCQLFAEVLERPDVTEESSFVSLGGDSLSYVEMSIRLERALGHLPANWHTTSIRDLATASIRDLAATAQPAPAASRVPADSAAERSARSEPATRTRPGWWRLSPARKATHRKTHSMAAAGTARASLGGASVVETSVALRAISIVLIVGTHAQLFAISGGAHLLLGVAGFNLARFHLTASARMARVRSILRSLRRIVIASVLWIGLAYLVTDHYALRHVFLVNYLVGPEGVNNDYWFIEALLYLTLGVTALLAVPAVDRLERRYPYGLPIALAVAGLVTRYELLPGVHLRTPAVVWWLFCLGWAAARASTAWQRGLVTLLTVATVPGFFGSPAREAVVIAGMLLLIWVPTLPSLRPLNVIAGPLAAASLYIYLTHWQVFPHLDQISSLLATVASLVVGIGVWALLRLGNRLRRLGREARRTVSRGASGEPAVAVLHAQRHPEGRAQVLAGDRGTEQTLGDYATVTQQ